MDCAVVVVPSLRTSGQASGTAPMRARRVPTRPAPDRCQSPAGVPGCFARPAGSRPTHVRTGSLRRRGCSPPLLVSAAPSTISRPTPCGDRHVRGIVVPRLQWPRPRARTRTLLVHARAAASHGSNSLDGLAHRASVPSYIRAPSPIRCSSARGRGGGGRAVVPPTAAPALVGTAPA